MGTAACSRAATAVAWFTPSTGLGLSHDRRRAGLGQSCDHHSSLQRARLPYIPHSLRLGVVVAKCSSWTFGQQWNTERFGSSCDFVQGLVSTIVCSRTTSAASKYIQ